MLFFLYFSASVIVGSHQWVQIYENDYYLGLLSEPKLGMQVVFSISLCMRLTTQVTKYLWLLR